jgi:hypothetical protein
LTDVLNILSERIALNLLKIHNFLASEDSLYISNIGLLDVFLIEVDSPLPEVVSPGKVNNIEVFKANILNEKTDGVRSDLMVDEHEFLSEIINPEILLGFFGGFIIVVRKRIVKEIFGIDGFGCDEVNEIFFCVETIVLDNDRFLVQLDDLPFEAGVVSTGSAFVISFYGQKSQECVLSGVLGLINTYDKFFVRVLSVEFLNLANAAVFYVLVYDLVFFAVYVVYNKVLA